MYRDAALREGGLEEPGEAPAVMALLAMLGERACDRVSHARATAQWTKRLTRALGWPRERRDFARLCALLHDVGMVGVPDRLLAGSEAFSKSQQMEMQGHCAAGERIVRGVLGLRSCAVVVRAHHERFDGLGYPDGLAGREIPAEARLIAVASSFQAMVEDRPHRRALPAREALARLARGRSTQWDPDAVDGMLGLFPARVADHGRLAS